MSFFDNIKNIQYSNMVVSFLFGIWYLVFGITKHNNYLLIFYILNIYIFLLFKTLIRLLCIISKSNINNTACV